MSTNKWTISQVNRLLIDRSKWQCKPESEVPSRVDQLTPLILALGTWHLAVVSSLAVFSLSVRVPASVSSPAWPFRRLIASSASWSPLGPSCPCSCVSLHTISRSRVEISRRTTTFLCRRITLGSYSFTRLSRCYNCHCLCKKWAQGDVWTRTDSASGSSCETGLQLQQLQPGLRRSSEKPVSVIEVVREKTRVVREKESTLW